ncbi:PAS domain S-box protein [Methanolobus psychrotolerans]|uniref:PAS domain S-box protein n=1 Tax=Methanolobus psychrotolerans TaxID=1874706 RepID=UPI0013EC11A0|nr:PAS domain S-box protein [Methanolobus psychrotolerans]
MKRKIEENIKLKKLVISSEELFQNSFHEISYQRITDGILDISEAKYAAFIRFEEKTNSFFTMAIAGANNHLKKASAILGFELTGKEWESNPILIKRISNNITRFPSIHDLIRGVFPEKSIILLERTFNAGETIIANIFRGNVNLGYFVLIMPFGEYLADEELIEIYTRQVGLLLERKKAEEELQFQFRFQKMVSGISAGFVNLVNKELEPVVDEALKTCGELFGVDRAYIFLFSENEGKMGITNEWCAKGIEPLKNRNYDFSRSKFPWFEKCIKRTGHIHVPDAEKLPQDADAERKELGLQSVKSLLSIAMTKDGKFIGLMGFDTLEKKNVWTEEQISLLKVAAGIITDAFEREHEDEKRRKREIQLSNAQKIGHMGSWEFDLNKGTVHASEEALKIYGVADTYNSIAEIQKCPLPQYRSMLANALKCLVTGKMPYDVQFKILRAIDGEIRDIHSVAEYNAQRNTVVGTIHDITDQKFAQEALLESERKYRTLYEATLSPILIVDGHGNYVDANNAALDFLETDIISLRGKKAGDYDPPRFNGSQMKEHIPFLQSRMLETFYDVNGKEKVLLLNVVPIETKEGMRLFGIGQDMTERKKAEEKLAEEAVWRRLLIEQSRDGGVILDLNGKVYEANEKFAKMLGYSPEEIMKLHIWEWDKQWTRSELLHMLHNVHTTEEYFLTRHIRKDGTFIDVEISSNEVIRGGQRLVFCACRDVSERVRDQKALRKSEKNYREIFNSTNEAIFIHDITTRKILDVNDAMLRMYGYTTKERVLSGSICDMCTNVFPYTEKEAIEHTKRTIEQGPHVFEWLAKKENGESFWVEVSQKKTEISGEERVLAVVRDINERKIVQEQLQNRTELLDMALKATCAGIWDLDLITGDITLQGLDSWEKITGYTTSDFTHYNLDVWAKMIHPDDAGLVTRKLQDTIEGKNQLFMAEYRMWHKEKRWMWVRAHGRIAMYDPTGKPLHMYGTHISINENKEAEEKANAANKAKSEFLANMSHEMRTPLNGIIGFSDLLLKSELSDQQFRYMKTVSTSASLLLDLINDVLDISKIEAGKLELDTERIDLVELCEQITDMLKYRVHEKGLELLMNMSPDLPRYIVADRLRLRQVLVNLLGNAIKFTSAGEIELKVEASSTAGKLQEMEFTFSVRDTGIGIAGENISRIFDSFSQADGTITRKYGGTGLGLSISNKLLEKMGSKLELESEEGKGSRFYFTVPFSTEQSEQIDSCCINDLQTIRKVLIVDDNSNNLSILQNMLQRFDIKADIASSGTKALDMLNNDTEYDLIIADIYMPVMGGYELVRNMRRESKLPTGVPAILMRDSTDISSKHDENSELGICASIIKPVRKAELFDAICQSNSSRKMDMNNELNEKVILPIPHLGSNNRNYSILIAEDNETNMILASIIISSLLPGAKILQAKDGKEAVRMYRENKPDIIFMDIQMPEFSGYDATALIRSTGSGNDKRTPIIALTAGIFKGEKERCIEAGMDDYVTKPIVSDTINHILNKWLLEQENPEPVKRSHENGPPVHFDGDSLMGSVNGNKELYDNLIFMAISSLARNFEDITDSFSQNDMEKVRSSAHCIKGTSLNIGFSIMADLTGELEKAVELENEKIPELLEKMKAELAILESNFK